MIDYTKDNEYLPMVSLNELGIELDLEGHQFHSDKDNVPYFEVNWNTLGEMKLYQAKPQFPCKRCGVHTTVLNFNPEKKNYLSYFNFTDRKYVNEIHCEYSDGIITEIVLPIVIRKTHRNRQPH